MIFPVQKCPLNWQNTIVSSGSASPPPWGQFTPTPSILRSATVHYLFIYEGDTGVHWAAWNGADACIVALKKGGAKMDIIGRQGYSIVVIEH